MFWTRALCFHACLIGSAGSILLLSFCGHISIARTGTYVMHLLVSHGELDCRTGSTCRWRTIVHAFFLGAPAPTSTRLSSCTGHRASRVCFCMHCSAGHGQRRNWLHTCRQLHTYCASRATRCSCGWQQRCPLHPYQRKCTFCSQHRS